MRKRMLMVMVTVLLIAVTAVGALAVAGGIGGGTGGGNFVLAGHTVDYRTDFRGEVTFEDPQRQRTGSEVRISGINQGQGVLTVSTGGQRHELRGTGRHRITGPDGKLLGYAVMRPMSAAEQWASALAALRSMGVRRLPRNGGEVPAAQQEGLRNQWETWGDRKETGQNGISTSPYGVLGFDNRTGVYWKMLGTGEVVVKDAEGKVDGSGSSQAFLYPEARDRKEPLFTITVDGRADQVDGYGPHEVRDSSGRLLMTLEAEPLGDR